MALMTRMVPCARKRAHRGLECCPGRAAPVILFRVIPFYALLAILTAISTPAEPSTQKCSPDTVKSFASRGAVADIRKAELQWAASIPTDEASFLRRVTAPDFTAVFDGAVIPRAAMIAGAEKRVPGTSSVTLTSLRVHVSGGVAIAEGDELWSVKAAGKRQHIVWADTWVYCGGTWRLRVSTAVGTPAK